MILCITRAKTAFTMVCHWCHTRGLWPKFGQQCLFGQKHFLTSMSFDPGSNFDVKTKVDFQNETKVFKQGGKIFLRVCLHFCVFVCILVGPIIRLLFYT